MISFKKFIKEAMSPKEYAEELYKNDRGKEPRRSEDFPHPKNRMDFDNYKFHITKSREHENLSSTSTNEVAKKAHQICADRHKKVADQYLESIKNFRGRGEGD